MEIFSLESRVYNYDVVHEPISLSHPVRYISSL